jgi:hypothetical protein
MHGYSALLGKAGVSVLIYSVRPRILIWPKSGGEMCMMRCGDACLLAGMDGNGGTYGFE